MATERPSVDQYFMDMTHLVKARGTCPRRRVGAVVVKDKRVLTTGYNGAPRNFPHPIDVGCLRDELQIPHGMVADICPCLHAEQNAIIQAATTGVSIDGAELYCTTQPCTQCSRMVANCGITRVVFEEDYPDPLAAGILTTAGVELWKWDAVGKTARQVQANTFEEAQDEVRRRFREGTLAPAPRGVGQALPMAGGAVAPTPLAPRPIPAKAAVQKPVAAPLGAAMEGESDEEPSGVTAAQAHVRDLKDDPQRAELIRRMAKDRAERKRKAAEGTGP